MVGELGAECTEIFINSPTELRKPFMDVLQNIRTQYSLRVKSLHTYASFTESYYFFSSYERRFYDSIEDFKRYFYGMGVLGAELLVMHGAKIPGSIPDEQVFERFDRLYCLGREAGITLCQENVVHYRSDPYVFAERFADNIAHIHISDYTDERDCVVPLCTGAKFDFPKFFRFMRDKGYKGDYMIELYEKSYETPEQIRTAAAQLSEWL